MLFSIVTISYNQAKYLGQCIKSVEQQSYKYIEHIVVDPGSTDGSRKIISENTTNKLKPIFETDDGPADGLNKGFSRARGDIYCYLNSDDYLHPKAIASVASYLKCYPTVDIVLGNAVQVNSEGHITRQLHSSIWTPYLYVLGAATAIQQATFFRASAFHAAIGFNVLNRTCWDGELLVDMALAGMKIGILPQTLAAFRMHSESICGSLRLKEEYKRDKSRIARHILGRDPDWREKILMYPAKIARRIYIGSNFTKIQG